MLKLKRVVIMCVCVCVGVKKFFDKCFSGFSISQYFHFV